MSKLTNSYRPLKKILMATTMIVSMSMISANATAGVGANELPTGENVVDGIVSFDNPASNQLDISQGSDRAVVSWESFNIGKNATVNVHQNASDILVNTTTNFGNTSKILGSLNADGTVMVLNPNGVLFGKNSKIDVGGIIASTGTLDTTAFMNGDNSFALTSMDGTGKITNKSTSFTVKDGGLAAFVAPYVVNSGSIIARMGTITLAAADSATITIDTYGDGLVELDTGIKVGTGAKNEKGVKNRGTLSANGGYVELTTKQVEGVVNKLINLGGIVQAQEASVDGAGTIILKADDHGGAKVIASAVIDAKTIELGANAVVNSKATSNAEIVNVKSDAVGFAGAYSLVNLKGALNLADGTYSLGKSTFNFDKNGVTISGASQDGTILDGNKINGYGIYLTANDATINNLTFIGGKHYGVKAVGDRLTLTNFTAKGAAKTEIDMNGVDEAWLTNVTADGEGTDGVGISMTNASDIYMENITTANNNWGGVGVYQNTDGLTVTGTNSFGEANKLYTEVDGYVAGGANPWTITGLKLEGFSHSLVNTGHRSDGGEFVYYQQSEADALNFALDMDAANTGYIQTTGADSKGYTVRENNFIVGQNATDSMSVQLAVAQASAGGVINVKDGTYDLGTSTLYYNKNDLTIQGSSQKGTILDGSKIGGYTIDLTADEATIANLTLLGGDHYGVKATGDNLTLTDFTIDGSYRTGVDMNGVNNAWLTNVTSKNADYGVGISMTNASNINLANITTANNAWGGVAVYHDVDGVTLTGANSLSEANKLYTEVETAAPDTITNLKLDGFSHSVINTGHRSGGENFTFYQQSEADALDFALGMNAASTGYVQTTGADSKGYTVRQNNFIVAQNATDSLSIQTAVDNASAGGTITVKEGTYDEVVEVTQSVALLSDEATLINSANSEYNVFVSADDVTVDGFRIIGDANAGTYDYGIITSGSSNVNITNNEISDTEFGIFMQSEGLASNGVINWSARSAVTPTDGSLIQNNVIHDMNGAFGQAIHIREGQYADIKDNNISSSKVGIAVEGMIAEIGDVNANELVVSGNTISASMIGIRSNMYNGGSDYSIENNNISAEGVDVDRRWTGVDVLSQTGDIATSFTNNVIDGSALDGSGRLVVGYEATNVASENVSINGGSITGVDYGVWATDGSSYTGAVNDLTVSNLTFNDVRKGDFLVEDTVDTVSNTGVNSTGAHVTIGAGNNFSGSAYDLVLKGFNATATSDADADVMSTLVTAGGVATYDELTYQTGVYLTNNNASIQNAVNATRAGGKVTVSNGSYNEYLTLNKEITINGSADTTLQGFGKGYGITLADGANGVTLSNLTVDGYNSGLKVADDTSIDGLTVTNSAFNNNVHGWYFAKGDNDANNHSTVTNVLVEDTDFEGNTGKGIYVEKLDNATFRRILVDGSGVDPSFIYHDVGIDINLKNGDYENITFDHLTIANSGANASNGKSGAAIWVKARNDGATYSLTPGSLANLVITNSNVTAVGDVALALGGDIDGITLENNTITGPQAITMYGDLADVTLAGNRINTRGTSEGILENRYASNGHAIGLHSNIEIDATDNTFNGTHVSDMTRTRLFNLEDNINHGLDAGYDGLVRTADGSIFVTGNDDASPSTDGFRGVRFANTGNLVGMQNVVNSLLPTLLANIAPAAGGDASAPATPRLLQLFSTEGLSNAMRRSNNVVVLNLNDSPVAMIRRTSSGSYELSVDESLLDL